MRSLCFTSLLAVVQLLLGTTAHATTPSQDRAGLRRISSQRFAVPAGSKLVAGADFEPDGKLPSGWSQGGGEGVVAADAPQGKAFFHMKLKKRSGLRSPVITGQPGTSYFLSFWIKSPQDPWITISFTSDEREPSYTDIHTPLYYPNFPLDTGIEWRQEGFYFAMPPQCKTIQFNFSFRNDGADGQEVCLDEVRLRTAFDPEMLAAYKAERANFPPYDVPPRQGDGKYLALSVAKWEGRAGIPGKPFVIWALGSSFTAAQGDGYELIQAIRERFPNAPPIIYRKHGGPGTPWEFVHPWIKQFVAAEEPDLIFTYTSGSLDGLENLLSEIRKRTTAEVIVPSLHFRPPPSAITPENITRGMGVEWAKAREICEKYGAEFVNNRVEMAEYLSKTGLDQDELLMDHNHQGMHGRLRIWDNVTRHLVKSDESNYIAESRERRISVVPPANTATEQVILSGNWASRDGVLRCSAAGARLKVSFIGNQINLMGRQAPNGGAVKVLIDGTAGDQASLFLMDCIKSNTRNWRSPHAVELGSNIVPQTWTITMTSNTGDYRLDGSVTGLDGNGNLVDPFISKSAQISIPPRFWRAGRLEKNGKVEYGNVSGETFTFDVFRSAVGEQSFKADKLGQFVEPLVRNLSNGTHTLELITTGTGEIAIDGLYVFQPPGK
jgi:hypothetical protein